MIEHKNTILAIVLSLHCRGRLAIFRRLSADAKAAREAPSSRSRRSCSAGAAGDDAAGKPAPRGAGRALPRQPADADPRREAVIAASPRVAIDTPRLHGSIDLKGGRIDDLSLEQYRETIDPNSPPIVLLSPSGAPEAYYAEFGWVPAAGTTRENAGSGYGMDAGRQRRVGIDHPVTLTYDNGEGLIFHRIIAVDDHYLFTIKD